MEDEIILYLQDKISPYVIILFGSNAKGTARKESDIDIAFLSEKEFSEYDLFLFSQELADKLKKDVDLVDLNKTSTVFKAQVIGTGKLLLDLKPTKRMLFFTRAFKEYAKLNEERKPVIENLKRSGTLYDK